jgi:DNA-binding MarR family transcriptional regulator
VDDVHDREDALTAVEVADAFSRTAKTLARCFDERLGEHGVSTPRSRVVVEVMRAQPVRVSDLALAVGITQGTASGLVEALVRDGLLHRDTDPVDRRAVRLNVTPSGEAFAREWLAGYQAAAEDLFAPLPRDQWPAFVEMLRHLT